MFIQLICKARRLKKRQSDLLKEKQDAILSTRGEHGDITLTSKQKYRHFCHRLRRSCIKCFTFPKHTLPYRLCFNLRHHGTCEHFLATSIAGFLGGFILTYIFFMFFVLQLNFTLSTATIMCSIFGSILTIGLAFSSKVRCVVFLVLPQFFSKKGRQALLAYAYILAITGPAKNTLNNMSILGESLACGQEQLKAAVKQILETVKKPFYAIRDAIKKVVVTVKEIVAKIKEILLGIKRIIMSLVKIIKSAFEFIAKMMNVCNQEFGTPFQRCERVFEDAIIDCNAKLGPMFNWLCNITYLVKSVCYLAKALDFLCGIIDFIKGTVSAITTKVKQFIRHIRTMFYVRIKFSHSYRMESNHTKSMADITTGIVTEIKQRSQGLIKIFDFMSSAASLFFIFMVVKVVYYRYNFLTNETFDNKFITKDFRKLDMRRAQLGLETVLPLNHRERKLYISTSSMRLVKKEKSRLSQAAMILLMSTLKLSTHMATDYSLYWIMTKIRYYGRFQSKIDAPNMPMVVVQGDGFLASLLKGIVKAFQPLGIDLEIDTIPCLPDPIPPDYDRYIQIGSLLILCWFLAIFEPYGLRFRHSVMCYYHPQRARERAIWLYNHILRSRSSFLKFARRQLKRIVKSDKGIAKITCMEFIRARAAKYKICVLIFGKGKQSYCLLCGEVHREDDKKVFIQCATPNCPGLFCEQCFQDLQNLCTVCLDPISYGDLSDISEEKDSSEDESKQKRKAILEEKQMKKKLKKKKKKKRKKKKSNDVEGQNRDEDEDEDSDSHDKTKLLSTKTGGETSGSDYDPAMDTDWSSDYDLTYQLNKDISKMSEDNTPKVDLHSDVEKQNIPEYATMQDFHTNVVYYLNWTTDDVEAYDTSSLITEIQEASLEHLNTSPVGNQAWLMRKDPQGSKRVTSDSYSDKSPISIQDYYNSEESEYEDDLCGKGIPLRRLNSKISIEEMAVVSPIEDSSEESSNITMGSLLSTTPNSGMDSDRVVHEIGTGFTYCYGVLPSRLPTLEPITEEPSKSRTITKLDLDYDIDDHNQKVYLNTNTTISSFTTLSQGTITKDQKEMLNEATSKESRGMITIETGPLLESINLDLPTVDTSPEVSPLSMTYTSKTVTPIMQHPDVPKLNLDFLESRETQGISSMEKYCECPPSTSGTPIRMVIANSPKTESTVTSTRTGTVDTTTRPADTDTNTGGSLMSFAPTKSRTCNCHMFQDKVTYNIVNENTSSGGTAYTTPAVTPHSTLTETSSVISSLHKQKLSSRRESGEVAFTYSPAKPETVTSTIPKMTAQFMQTLPPPPTFSVTTSQMSVKKCSLDYSSASYYDNVDVTESPSSQSGTRSVIDYNSATSPEDIYDSANTSSADTIFVVPKVPPKEGFVVERVRSESSQKDLYKERIKEYYRHLNVKSVETPRKKKKKKTPRRRNLVKTLWHTLIKKKS